MAADEQKDFWGKVATETAMVLLACDHADATAKVVCQIFSVGANPAETHRQVAEIVRDDNIELLREYQANRA